MVKGRVIEVHRTNFTVSTDGGDLTATVRGNFHEDKDFPKVGDYVELSVLDKDRAVIDSIYERRSLISRKVADSDKEQVIVTNVDVIFIVMGLDNDFNINRLQRYLLLSKKSNIFTVIVLNKLDLVGDTTEDYIEKIESVSGRVPLMLISAQTGEGMNDFYQYINSEVTAVLLGSSGAGKSTITNWLLGADRQVIKETREDDGKGRHTTTSRQLFKLPNGGYLIDTPGMRELGLVEVEADDEKIVFDKIDSYARECRFSNCDHDKSEGCAVLSAIEEGLLSERDLNNYHKILRERAFLENKDKGLRNSLRHQEQAQKRQLQKDEALKRKRLISGR